MREVSVPLNLREVNHVTCTTISSSASMPSSQLGWCRFIASVSTCTGMTAASAMSADASMNCAPVSLRQIVRLPLASSVTSS